MDTMVIQTHIHPQVHRHTPICTQTKKTKTRTHTHRPTQTHTKTHTHKEAHTSYAHNAHYTHYSHTLRELHSYITRRMLPVIMILYIFPPISYPLNFCLPRIYAPSNFRPLDFRCLGRKSYISTPSKLTNISIKNPQIRFLLSLPRKISEDEVREKGSKGITERGVNHSKISVRDF